MDERDRRRPWLTFWSSMECHPPPRSVALMSSWHPGTLQFQWSDVAFQATNGDLLCCDEWLAATESDGGGYFCFDLRRAASLRRAFDSGEWCKLNHCTRFASLVSPVGRACAAEALQGDRLTCWEQCLGGVSTIFAVVKASKQSNSPNPNFRRYNFNRMLLFDPQNEGQDLL